MPRLLLVLALAFGAAGCGGLPTRFVVERDIGDYLYRRYQRVLDVEFRVEENAAVGHTASYVRRDDADLYVATAFVTVYDHPRALTAEVREALQGLGSYEMEVGRHSGEYVWELDDGSDRWWVWVSGRHVVKIGAPQGHEIPEDVADEYLDLYPSDLDERGRAREGSASAGRSLEEREEEGELDVPFHLRTGQEREQQEEEPEEDEDE